MTEQEVRVLYMCAKRHPWESGSWVDECLKKLVKKGMVEDVLYPKLTLKGEAMVEEEE